MNFGPEDIANTLVRDRMRIGSSLADVDPMSVDKSVSFHTDLVNDKYFSKFC